MEETKNKNQYMTVPERIEACEKILTGAGKPEMLALLNPYITSESLAPGLDQLVVAKAQEKQQRKLVKQLDIANAKFKAEHNICEAKLKATRKLAKLLGRHYPEILNEMGLSAALPSKQITWITAALEFYEDAIGRDDLIAEVETKGLSKSRLEAEYAQLQTLKPLKEEALRLDSEKQQSTQDRNAQLDALEDNCKEILALAELALNEKGKPQLLERLGKIVK